MRSLRLVLILSAMVTVPTLTLAVGSGGITNEVISAESLSELIGVTGSKSDPLVLYNNPASIGDLGKANVSAGVAYFHTSASRSGNGTSDTMNHTNALAPNFGAVGSILDGKVGFGIALVNPYGL